MTNVGDPGSVLVTGATGTVGRPLVEALLAAGHSVRAGVHAIDADLPEGAEMTRLDFFDPSTVEPAMAGVDRLFLMRPPAISDVKTAFGPLVAAAARQRVRRVIVLSVMGVNPALPHWRLERMVTRSGLAMTALRPAYFAQNLLTPFGAQIRDHSELALAAGNGLVSFVDTRDVAAVAARILGDPDSYEAAPLTLTGPQALSFADAASVLSAELRRAVTYRRQSFRQRRAALRAQPVDPAYVRVQLIIDLTTRLGLAAKVTQDVAHVLGRPAASLADFVRDHRDRWAPTVPT